MGKRKERILSNKTKKTKSTKKKNTKNTNGDIDIRNYSNDNFNSVKFYIEVKKDGKNN